MGAIVGTVLGVTGAVLGVWNSKRIAKGKESFLKMRRWNACDFLYASLITAGLLCLTGGVLSIHFEMMNDGFALCLFSWAFLSTGFLNAIIRIRALQA